MNHPPPTTAALPRGKTTPKSPKTKDIFFGTLERITRQPSVRQEREAKTALREASVRVRQLEKVNSKAWDNFHPEDYHLKNGEERRYLDPKSEKLQEVQDTIASVTNWINNELEDAGTRMRVENIETDLFDGLVLKVLVQKLSGKNIPMPAGEFVQSDERQKINVKNVVEKINDILNLPKERITWDVASIFDKNLLATLTLLLAIVRRFHEEGKIPIDLPNDLKVGIITVKRENGNLIPEISSMNLIQGHATSRDGFDTLIDHAPEKLQYVKRSLLQFANVYLNKINRSVSDISTDFCNGVNLILLIGLLEGFFVPLYEYDPNPTTPEGRLSNLTLAFEFLSGAGIRPPNRPADVARGDIKATLRILYCLFVKYRGEQEDRQDEAALGMAREDKPPF